MTQKEMYNVIINALNGETVNVPTSDMIEFLNGRIAQIDKKNANRKTGLTETQKENIELGKQVLEYMNTQPTKEWLISEIRKHFGLTSQKLTPIMTSLVNDGKVEKIVEKRVNFYRVC